MASSIMLRLVGPAPRPSVSEVITTKPCGAIFVRTPLADAVICSSCRYETNSFEATSSPPISDEDLACRHAAGEGVTFLDAVRGPQEGGKWTYHRSQDVGDAAMLNVLTGRERNLPEPDQPAAFLRQPPPTSGDDRGTLSRLLDGSSNRPSSARTSARAPSSPILW